MRERPGGVGDKRQLLLLRYYRTYHWHSRHEAVEYTAPRGRHEQFHGANVIVGALGVDRTKGNRGRNHGNKEEKGNGHGFGVEIGHFFDPMFSNR